MFDGATLGHYLELSKLKEHIFSFFKISFIPFQLHNESKLEITNNYNITKNQFGK